MSRGQIEVIYKLVELGKLSLNDAMKILPRSEVQKIILTYKKLSQEEKMKVIGKQSKNSNLKINIPNSGP